MKKALIALILSAGVGCDDEKKEAAASKVEPPKALETGKEAISSKAPVGDAGVAGVVKIKGTVRNPIIPMSPECVALHGGKPVRSEEVVVDGENHVKWALVYIKAGLGEGTYEPPKEPVELDQQGCMYKPHVFGIRVGQPLRIKNSDPFLHNVHGLPFSSREFNIAQQPGSVNDVKFTQPEKFIKVKCDIHAWMGAWGHALDHPFFAVTDSAGKFSIPNLPSGKYTVEVMHEAYKSVTMEIEVKAGETKTADFELVDRKGP